MGERGMQIKADINKEGWEQSEFPLVCETCLGDNPYIRMTKERFGKTCKICDRPFTIFSWKPGSKARFKKTEVCQTCAKMKNVCQTCILDLTYGLPVQVRDSLLEGSNALTVPQSDTNKQWFAGQHDRMVAEGHMEGYGKAQLNEKLLRMARSAPYYKRNLPHKCSFYAKGECSRGDRCPFLHEMPTPRDDPLANQNIKDRFYGQDDPVAEKILRRQAAMATLTPPEDQSVTTLWVGGLEDYLDITEADLRDQFYAFGEISSVRMVPRQHGAFIEYTTREAAEEAAKTLSANLFVKGGRLRLAWAHRPAGPPPNANGAVAQDSAAPAGSAPPAAPLPPPGLPPGAELPRAPPAVLNFVPTPPPHGWQPGAVPPPPPMPPPPGFHLARAPPPPSSVIPRPPPPTGTPPGYFQGGIPRPPRGLPPRPYYPSMDPQRMGARIQHG